MGFFRRKVYAGRHISQQKIGTKRPAHSGQDKECGKRFDRMAEQASERDEFLHPRERGRESEMDKGGKVMEDAVKYDPGKSDQEKFDKIVKDMLHLSDEMIDYYYDIKHMPKADLLFNGAQDIRRLVNILKVYERNLDKAMSAIVNHIESIKDLSFRWGLATTILDQSVVDSIMLLSDKRKGRKNDSGGTDE